MTRALLVDAAGTLLFPAEPVGETYARVAAAHGVEVEPAEAARRFREAFGRPWTGLRYVGDGRPFWRAMVAASVGSADEGLFEDLYEWFARPEAWRVAPADREALARARREGVRLALVSDWDRRLRPLLGALDLVDAFDAVAISCEVGAEKPDPALFHSACDTLGVRPDEAVHVGDRARDVAGAAAAGCAAWRIGADVASVAAAVDRLGAERGIA